MRAYVEVQTDPNGDPVARAWAFDLAHWGISRAAETTAGALSSLQRATGASAIELEEIVEDHDPAFARDLEPARPGERAATIAILDAARRRTLALVASASQDQLTRPSAWAPHIESEGWQSALDLAWSFADVESRIYLPALGLPTRRSLLAIAAAQLSASRTLVAGAESQADVLIDEPAADTPDIAARVALLPAELEQSHAHVIAQVRTLPDVRIRTTPEGGEWTSVKLLRTLAWRERSLLPLFEALLAQG